MMKVCAAIPAGLVDVWLESVESLPAREEINFHYHDVEEWLTVVSGEITFFTLADEPFQIDTGRSLHIPCGEVHRVQVGSQGVEYRMFLPIAVPTFVNNLSQDMVDALRRNLEFPEYEDGHAENGREFFESILSDQLVFYRADGKCVYKKEFIRPFVDETFVPRNRLSSGSIQVLVATDNGLLK
jgi:hypothetical protein